MYLYGNYRNPRICDEAESDDLYRIHSRVHEIHFGDFTDCKRFVDEKDVSSIWIHRTVRSARLPALTLSTRIRLTTKEQRRLAPILSTN